MSRYDVHRPHDSLFRAVFSDPAAAVAFLRANLPESVSAGLQWSTLALRNNTFIDDELRNSESDLLFAVDRQSGRPAWLYVLLEHQSTPSRWMRFRLLKYCSRIWDRDRSQSPNEPELRPIVPLVFYQGARPWKYSTEFSDLFAEGVREWSWLPRFQHLLIDQSVATVDAIMGELKGRIAQLTMMAAYRDHWAVLQRVMPMLNRLYRRGGVAELRPFVLYVLATQTAEIRQRFVAGLRSEAPGAGGDAMNYLEQLIHEGVQQGLQQRLQQGLEQGLERGVRQGREEGERTGRIKGRVGTIEELLRAGVEWSTIESATGIDQDSLRVLKQQLDESDDATTDDR